MKEIVPGCMVVIVRRMPCGCPVGPAGPFVVDRLIEAGQQMICISCLAVMILGKFAFFRGEGHDHPDEYGMPVNCLIRVDDPDAYADTDAHIRDTEKA